MSIHEDQDQSVYQTPNNSVTDSSIFASPQKRVFKIIVVGDSCVGKTCLTYRFCEGRFPSKTEATIGVNFRERTVEVDGEAIKLWDTGFEDQWFIITTGMYML